jgi:adenylate kinase
MYDQPKTIVFLGPPGSGKGTQAARLSAALELPSISTGEMLRRECQSGSEFGRKLDALVRSGQLVSDELINRLVETRLRRKDCQGGCILDGFPRTVQQARYLDGLLKRLGMGRPLVFDFIVRADELIERLRHRRQCPTCGRIYAAADISSGAALHCQNDHSLLVPRADDQPKAIRERLRVYAQNSTELVSYYRDHEYHPISAGLSPDEVTEQIFAGLGLASITPRPSVRASLAFAAS